MANRAISRRRSASSYQPDLYDDEPPYITWLASIVLFVLAIAPYILGDALIELEVFVAQPMLRLFMLLAAGLLAGLAAYRLEYIAAALPGLCFLFLLFETGSHIGLAPFADAPADHRKHLHVYSQNIGMESPEGFIGLLAPGTYDLVLLQEVYVGHRKGWEVLAEQLDYEHYYHILRSDAGMGAFFMSRTPMQPLPILSVQSWGRKPRYFPGVQIEFDGQKTDVYSIHLESLPLVEGQRMIMGGSALRKNQAQVLREAAATSPHHIIIAGDFNAAPLYASAQPLRDLLDDVWEEGGFGFGFTYHASLPLARIDHILQRGFSADYAEVIKASDSDHRGIYAVLSLETVP